MQLLRTHTHTHTFRINIQHKWTYFHLSGTENVGILAKRTGVAYDDARSVPVRSNPRWPNSTRQPPHENVLKTGSSRLKNRKMRFSARDWLWAGAKPWTPVRNQLYRPVWSAGYLGGNETSETLECSFSAISTPIFESRLHILHTFAPLRTEHC